jgi:hypothetical protein
MVEEMEPNTMMNHDVKLAFKYKDLEYRCLCHVEIPTYFLLLSRVKETKFIKIYIL